MRKVDSDKTQELLNTLDEILDCYELSLLNNQFIEPTTELERIRTIRKRFDLE